MDSGVTLIAWVGGMYFQEHMEPLGFRTRCIALTAPRALTWEDIVASCGQVPDAVVYTDRSLPPPLLGVERFPCLTAFYCIDSHIHSWYPLYAGCFDLCAVSLKDHLSIFERELSPRQTIWLPPYASEHYQPATMKKQCDLLFVGTVDPQTTPRRYDFLRRLSGLFPGLQVRQGDFTRHMPQARVVLNIAERGDLNFRVFESLACGSCLLTPRIGNGQDELFEEGVQLATYEGDNEFDALAKTQALLADDARRAAMARAGLALVNGSMRPWHRAASLAGLLRYGFEAGLPGLRLTRHNPGRSMDLRRLWLHWAEHIGQPELSARYLEEARRQTPARGPGTEHA